MDADEFNAALKTFGMRRRELADVLGVALVTVNVWGAGTREVPPYVAAYFALKARILELEGTVASLRTLLFDSERRAAGAPIAPL